MRNSDVLEIATLADFFGTSWQVNALMIPNNIPQRPPLPGMTPQLPYLQPVGAVMSLFCHHQGKYDIDISYNGAIDATASKTDNKIFIHVANTDMNSPHELELDTLGHEIESVQMFYIASKADTEITVETPDCFAVKEQKINGRTVTLPPAAVAAIEVVLKK